MSKFSSRRAVRAALAACLIVAGSAGSAFAILPKTLIKEGDAIAGSTVLAITNVATNRTKGFIVGINDAAGIAHFWGDANGGPGNVLRSEGVFGPLTQTAFESFFGFGDAGNIAYSPTVTGGVVASADSVFNSHAPVAVEGEAVTSIPGQFWRFASRPTSTGTGEAWWAAGLTTTSGGATQSRGLFKGTGINVLRSGDTVVGATEPINSATAISFDFGVSASGNHYICEANLTAASAIDTAVVMDGAILTLDAGTALVREGQVIPASIDGSGIFLWSNFDFVGATNSGRYFFTGDTNAAATEDEFIIRDGAIYLRDGAVLGADTVQGDIEAAVMNEAGDLACIWDVSANTIEALIVNKRIILKEGDPVDYDNDNLPDANSAIVDFTNIACLGLTSRAGGKLGVYFTADVDMDGTLTTTTDRIEGAFRIEICLADANTDGSLSVQDIFDFLGQWFAADPRADFNGDAAVTVQDIFDFLSAWFAGC